MIVQAPDKAGGNNGFTLAGKKATKMLHINRQTSGRRALGFYTTPVLVFMEKSERDEKSSATFLMHKYENALSQEDE